MARAPAVAVVAPATTSAAPAVVRSRTSPTGVLRNDAAMPPTPIAKPIEA